MKKTLLHGLIALITLAGVASRASAQQCTTPFGNPPQSCVVTLNLSLNAQRTVQVVISPTTVNFGTPTASDYGQGFTQAPAMQTVTINANNPWTLSIQSAQANWTNVGAGSRATKPRADLQWATVIGGPYSGMTGTAATIASNNATNSTNVNVFYRVLWAWALDSPGTYTLPITIVITAP